MTRIAYIGPTGIFGGVRIIHEHLNRLLARGHDCTLIYTDPQPLTWLPARYTQRPLADPGSGYDVIVGTALPTWPIARQMAGTGRALGLLQMAEWLFTAQGSAEYHQLMHAFGAPLDGVLAISAWLAQLCDAMPQRAVYRIRNGIDMRLFYPDPFPDIPSFAGVTICTEGVGGSNPAKDIEEMTLRAIRRLRYDDGIALRVIGFSQVPAQSEIYERYWVQPTQQVIRHIYSSADIFMKASRYEGRPGPDLEAMACGAVVCRAIGTGDDDLRDGENCLRVPYGDMDGYIANLRRLIQDVELRRRLRQGGLEYVRQHCGWDGAIDLVETALCGQVGAARATPRDTAYDLSVYDGLQAEIVAWEGGQAAWLGETLAEMIRPRSVIDIGCGPGSYLVPFKPHSRVLGVDGAPASGRMLDPHEIVHADLRSDWAPPEHYDLALCIETAEHLPPDRAEYLVSLIATCADVCCWSAAQPGQGGTLHLNEQPQEYWLGLFRERGWELHPRHAELRERVARNPHCQRVQWLINNVMLLRKANGDQLPATSN